MRSGLPVICSRIVVYFQHIYPSHAEARCFCAEGKWKDARRVTHENRNGI